MKKEERNTHNSPRSLMALFCILVAILFFVVLLWTVISVVRFIAGISLGA